VIDRAVGQSHFRCDLAVRREGDDAYRLGILVDNQAYYEQSDLLERDMMRPKLLRNFGWKVAFVLAKDWYEDRAAVLDHLRRLLEGEEEPDEAAEEELADDEEFLEDDAEDESPSDEPLDLDLSGESAQPDDVSRPQAESSETVDEDSSESPFTTAVLTNEGTTRRFEFSSDTSNKFWEITLSDGQHTVRFGRIGTKGQTKTKQFGDADKARHDAERLIRGKLAKGYRER